MLKGKAGNVIGINAVTQRRERMKIKDNNVVEADGDCVTIDRDGADALAWTALKAGKLSAAQTAIKDALRLNTKDARLFYHAGMIEKASGNDAQAKDYLRRALKMNPMFDALPAEKARATLAELR